LKFIHPGLTETDWTNAKVASATLGTGNAAIRATSRVTGVGGNSINVVIATPAGSAPPHITHSGSTFTITPKTGETALGLVEALQSGTATFGAGTEAAFKSATTGIQIGLPSTSDGSGTLIAVTSTALTGGLASTATLGKVFSPSGYVPFTAYFDNLVLALEGVNTQVLQLWRVDNAVQNDDISIEPDDSGAISGISCSFAGHVSDAQFDASIGTYIPPYKVYNLNTPASL
jgi:hypothetical protein